MNLKGTPENLDAYNAERRKRKLLKLLVEDGISDTTLETVLEDEVKMAVQKMLDDSANWQKLSSLGISDKILRLILDFLKYKDDQATSKKEFDLDSQLIAEILKNGQLHSADKTPPPA